MKCSEAMELISAQLDGTLSQEQQNALQAHLSSCPECRALAQELSQLEQELPTLEQEPPKQLHDGVMREIRRQSRHKKEQVVFLRFLGTAAAAAALLAVLAGFNLITLPSFGHGEAGVSMAESLFPKKETAKEYAERLARETGCRVLLIERCSPEELGGTFEDLGNGIYRRELTEDELDQIEGASSGKYVFIAGTRREADKTAYLLCTP